MRQPKKWWNHETFTLKVPIVEEDGLFVHEVKPGGSVLLDSRYTRHTDMSDGTVREHVDCISPHLRPDEPVEGREFSRVEVVGVDDEGRAKTKVVKRKQPKPLHDAPTVKAPRRKVNPNAKKVQASKRAI